MAQAKRRGWRQGENEWTILAFSVCHFVGSLLFWPLGVRARSVGRREQVSGDDTQYDLVCLFIRSFGLVIRV